MCEAQQYGAESLAGIAKAIDRIETYTRFRPFKAFQQEQAIGFKRHLKEQRGASTGKPLSLATQLSTLSALKAFFRWLAGQQAYKKQLHYTDASYFSLGRGAYRQDSARESFAFSGAGAPRNRLDALLDSY